MPLRNESPRRDIFQQIAIRYLVGYQESSGTTKTIDKYSAGCQVFQNADDFARFMTLCRKHTDLYRNSFTYTLIDFRAIARITVKRIIAGMTVVAAGAFG